MPTEGGRLSYTLAFGLGLRQLRPKTGARPDAAISAVIYRTTCRKNYRGNVILRLC